MALALIHEANAGSSAWLVAHQELSRLAKARASLDWEEGCALLAALRADVYRRLGFGSFVEYVESLFGYKPRSTDEKVRVAQALEALPLLSNSLREGSLSWSAARELTRVATAETESAWRDAIQRMNIRQIEQLVSGRRPGDTPHSPSDPALRKHLLAFEVPAETLATYREALAQLRRDAGGPLDEETALLLMARQVLAGPRDSGRANYQVAITLCEQCGRGFQEGRGERFEVTPDVLALASCDAQYIGNVAPTPTTQNATRPRACADDPEAPHSAHVGAPASRERACEARAVKSESRSLVPGQVQSKKDYTNSTDTAHVGATPQRTERESHSRAVPAKSAAKRASQSIPPATRRLVLRRGHGRCVVPGCRHAVFVDVHHLALRSEGGGHDPDRLVVLCAAHHRAVHRGQLMLEGSVSAGLVFRHADGSPYGSRLSATAADAHSQAFAALRRLGFREGEVRRALDRLRAHSGHASQDSEAVVRAALRALTESVHAAGAT